MPKSENFAREQPSALSAEEVEIPSQQDETTGSEQESDAEVSFHTFRHQAQPQSFLTVGAQEKRCNKCGDSTHLEGFQYPAKKFQCKVCHKFGHHTSLCFQKI